MNVGRGDSGVRSRRGSEEKYLFFFSKSPKYISISLSINGHNANNNNSCVPPPRPSYQVETLVVRKISFAQSIFYSCKIVVQYRRRMDKKEFRPLVD